jgi:hypothetical protein
MPRLGHGDQDFAGHQSAGRPRDIVCRGGKSERAIMNIMNQTGHRSLMTVRRYIRQGSVFRENGADGLGL